MLAQLLNQKITIYPKTGLDKYGRETTSTGVDYFARVEEVSRSKMQSDGEVVVVDLVIYILPTTTVSHGDILEYNSIKYKVISRKDSVDGQGEAQLRKLELMKV